MRGKRLLRTVENNSCNLSSTNEEWKTWRKILNSWLPFSKITNPKQGEKPVSQIFSILYRVLKLNIKKFRNQEIIDSNLVNKAKT